MDIFYNLFTHTDNCFLFNCQVLFWYFQECFWMQVTENRNANDKEFFVL